MKKLAVLSMVMVLGAGAAMAASLSVPFFLDNGGNFSGGLPTGGNAAFVGIKNNLGVPVDIVVEYTSFPDGVLTIETTSTFTMAPNSAISWRPIADDPVEDTGQVIENMASGAVGGSVKVTFVRTDDPGLTTTSDVQGRYVEITPDGNRYGYLLPPGF